MPPAQAAAPRAIEDFIPEDVESSFGGATGDLWSDSAEPAFGQDEVARASTADDRPDTEGQAAGAKEGQGARPERHAPRERSGGRQRGGAARGAPTSPTHVAGDTVEGRAFARLQELFPGRVLEVSPLRPVAATGEQAEEAAGTTEEYGAGYDGAEEPDPPGSDE
ncbi:MAG: hypothetical protein KF875_01755 [Trueperaceae bacterium]|nr:hypothetical protein [Trueperaceae bacterium]MCO5172838.1 hypothetical protein [Trueperaceae bacterium]